jgi:hypothetical protein
MDSERGDEDMDDRRGAYARAISGVALAMALAAMSAGCSAGGSHTNASSNAVVLMPGPPGVKMQSHTFPAGPTIRVMPDGSVIHIDLPPWERPLSGPHTAPVQYHGGSVIDKSVLYAIFWRPPGYYMSPKYIPTIKRFFNDVGAGTRQYQILVQYSDTDGNPLNSSSLGGAWTDTSKFPAHMNDGTVRAEVLKAIQTNGWPTGGYQPIFVVFTASQAKVNFALCAYHGSFVNNSQQIAYSIVPYQHDVGPMGCGTPTNKWPNDRDADQTIDTLWHEEAETVSDPVMAWWRDSDGQEIGDICQTTYAPRGPDGGNTTLNGHRYITQELQSNLDARCKQQEPKS